MEEGQPSSPLNIVDTEGEHTAFAEAILSLVPITVARLLVDPLPDEALRKRLLERNPAITFTEGATTKTCDAALVTSDRDLARRLRCLADKMSNAGSCTVHTVNPHYWRFADAWLMGREALACPGLSLEEMTRAIAEAGLEILKIRTVRPDPMGAKAAAEALIPFGKRHGLTAQALFDRIAPIGFIAQIRPLAAGAPITVTAKTLGSKPDAMAIVRMHGPLAALATLPQFTVGPVSDNPSLTRQPDGTKRDLFIWQRPILTREHLPAIEKIRDTHRRFIVEFDDHPMRWPAIAANDYLTFRAPDAVRTSTETLAEIMRQWNPNVFVSPNQIEILPPVRPVGERSGPVRLLFAALNRKEDWTPHIRAVNRILARYSPDVLRVDIVFDRALFAALDARDKHFHSIMTLAEYKALLAQSDVAWLPLEDTLFNRCKSDLKFIECAAHGVAVVASPVVYGSVVRTDETGLIYRSPQELTAYLAQLIEDKALRARLSRAAHDEIATTRLRAQHTAQEALWYRDLLERSDMLEAERIARMAKMGAETTD